METSAVLSLHLWSLDEAAKTEQLKRYLNSLDNLILTDYLEFRWYANGQHRYTARIGTPTGSKINKAPDLSAIEQLLTEFLAQSPQKIASSQEVAQRMAKLTHMIHTIVIQAFEQGQASHLLKDLRQALAQTLFCRYLTTGNRQIRQKLTKQGSKKGC